VLIVHGGHGGFLLSSEMMKGLKLSGLSY
jgi:hypothetical protein